ncbi:hypothetical protein M5E89_04785 [Acidaminococcus intestini]|nr:hypothetical protein M5E89_04785 [Acidaminococcus intestini]
MKPCFQKSGIGTALVKKVIRLPQRRDLLMQPFWGSCILWPVGL